jgi:hypothetical protein
MGDRADWKDAAVLVGFLKAGLSRQAGARRCLPSGNARGRVFPFTPEAKRTSCRRLLTSPQRTLAWRARLTALGRDLPPV